MSASLRLVSSRELGQFPLSMGTSLALEGLADIYPDRPKPRSPTANEVDELWVNVRTLYRNLHASLPPNSRGIVRAEDLHDALKREIGTLKDVVDKFSEGKIKAVFYICNYDNLKREFPNAIINEPRTKIQHIEHALETHVLTPFLRGQDSRVVVHGVYPRGETRRRVAMLTHLPLDLVHRHDFGKLMLLESHTGVLKPHTQFYTKLRDQRLEMDHIPFTSGTLQIFGDSGKLFAMQPSSLRDYVVKVATDGKWTPATTQERMLFTVKNHPLKDIQAQVLKLLR